MEAIGGFFGLENITPKYHKDAIALSNGRACLSVILKNLSAKKVFVPFYCCDSLLEPFTGNGSEFSFYAIDENFEPLVLPVLKDGEYFLYINYFGLKEPYVNYLVGHYKEKLIVDNTQSFFSKGYEFSWSFNSARKFFGVPDGAFLYSPRVLSLTNVSRNTNYRTEHLSLRLEGNLAQAYDFYQKNEELQNCSPFLMSYYSEHVLSAIDFEEVKKIRRENYLFLNKELKHRNQLKVDLKSACIPFSYPFLDESLDRQYFIDRNVFIPCFWADVTLRKSNNYLWEKRLASNMLPLPIDHRYTLKDMKRIVNAIDERK